jgi:hypothetical protein
LPVYVAGGLPSGTFDLSPDGSLLAVHPNPGVTQPDGESVGTPNELLRVDLSAALRRRQ